MDIKGFQLGLRGHDIADTFSDMCVLANENDVTNLQFALAKTVSDINFDEVGYDADLSKKIKAKLDEHKLSVSVLGCYINPIAENLEMQKAQLKRFENFIDYAKDFEATVIGTETGVLVCADNPHKVDIERTHSEEVYQLFLNNLRPLVKKAEGLGVTVGIEPVWECPICTPKVMKRLLDDINSDNMLAILDVSNMINLDNYKNQREMIDEAFDLFGEKIRVIHLKDFTISEENGKKFAAAGTGDLEIEHMFKRIDALKNKPEIILDGLPLANYKETVERLKNIVK